MGNCQDTFNSCAASYCIDRNGFIWADIHSISDFDRDSNYFFYSFQSINRENGKKENIAFCIDEKININYHDMIIESRKYIFSFKNVLNIV